MRIRLSYLEVHNGSTVFMGGNIGTKIEPAKRPGMIVERDMLDGSVYIQYRQSLLILERTSVFSWAPESPADVGMPDIQVAPKVHKTPVHMQSAVNDAQVASSRKGLKSAQVGTPADALTHLQAAPKYRPHPAKPTPPPVLEKADDKV